MHGDELPDENSIFHKTFDEGPKWTGGASPSATPELFGPRNCGQEDAASRPETPVKKRRANRTEIRSKIIVRINFGDRRYQALSCGKGQDRNAV